jgi:hypothetical protein
VRVSGLGHACGRLTSMEGTLYVRVSAAVVPSEYCLRFPA